MNEAIQEMFKDVNIQLEFKVVELEALYTAWRARRQSRDERPTSPPTTSPM